MKKIKIIVLFLSIILIGHLAFAGKGYDLGPSINWDVNSGTSFCPEGKQLLGIYANKEQARTGTANCYTPDNNYPDISVNLNGYQNDTWTKNDVEISIVVSDSGAGLKEAYYIVNGDKIEFDNSSNIKFTEEGVYYIDITAVDKAENNSENGGSTNGNLITKQYIVKIDKSAPVFINSPLNTGNSWAKSIPNLSSTINDEYGGVQMISKEFSCVSLPENASWTNPVRNGKIVGYCNPNTGSCSNNNNFIPNNANCSWECNSGYIKGGLECHLENINLNCSAKINIPTNIFNYDKNNILIDAGVANNNEIFWSSPSGVTNDGSFTSFYNNGIYNPKLDDCRYDCAGGYHKERGKCVNDISIVCCSKSPLSKSIDTGPQIDCNLSENSNLIQCQYNNLCGAYVKDVLGEWDNIEKKWQYSDNNNTYNSVVRACGYEPIDNSDGYTCNEEYYLEGEGTPIAPYRCEKVDIIEG